MQTVFLPEDLEVYFAGTKLLETPELVDNAVLQALALAESPSGANRRLEVTRYTEVKTIPSVGRVFLHNAPLKELITIQIRGGNSYLYGDFLSLGNEWRTLADGYQVDYERGEIAFQTFATHAGFHGAQYRSNPLSRHQPVQCRIEYDSGFDWCSNNPDVLQLKAALAGLVNLTSQSKGFASGIKSFAVESFYEVGFDVKASANAIDSYLSVFRKWRAR